jgi:hypothetical protein
MELVSQYWLELVVLCLCFAVGGMGKFCRWEFSKIGLFAVYSDGRNPTVLSFAPRYPDESRCVGLLGFARKVLHILRLACLSQIVKSVVAWIAVNVVYVLFRPTPVKVKPHQTMGVALMLGNRNLDPAVSGYGSGNIANFFLASMPNGLDPNKDAGVGVVAQVFAQKFWGNIGFSHDAPRKRIGQRLGSVDALAGLRYFNTRTSSGSVTF